MKKIIMRVSSIMMIMLVGLALVACKDGNNEIPVGKSVKYDGIEAISEFDAVRLLNQGHVLLSSRMNVNDVPVIVNRNNTDYVADPEEFLDKIGVENIEVFDEYDDFIKTDADTETFFLRINLVNNDNNIIQEITVNGAKFNQVSFKQGSNAYNIVVLELEKPSERVFEYIVESILFIDNTDNYLIKRVDLVGTEAPAKVTALFNKSGVTDIRIDIVDIKSNKVTFKLNELENEFDLYAVLTDGEKIEQFELIEGNKEITFEGLDISTEYGINIMSTDPMLYVDEEGFDKGFIYLEIFETNDLVVIDNVRNNENNVEILLTVDNNEYTLDKVILFDKIEYDDFELLNDKIVVKNLFLDNNYKFKLVYKHENGDTYIKEVEYYIPGENLDKLNYMVEHDQNPNKDNKNLVIRVFKNTDIGMDKLIKGHMKIKIVYSNNKIAATSRREVGIFNITLGESNVLEIDSRNYLITISFDDILTSIENDMSKRGESVEFQNLTINWVPILDYTINGVNIGLKHGDSEKFFFFVK